MERLRGLDLKDRKPGSLVLSNPNLRPEGQFRGAKILSGAPSPDASSQTGIPALKYVYERAKTRVGEINTMAGDPDNDQDLKDRLEALKQNVIDGRNTEVKRVLDNMGISKGIDPNTGLYL